MVWFSPLNDFVPETHYRLAAIPAVKLVPVVAEGSIRYLHISTDEVCR